MTKNEQLRSPYMREGIHISHTSSEEVPEGHSYDVNFNKKNAPLITLAEIRFQNGPVPICGINGVTTEDLLVVLIHRTGTLHDKIPCEENKVAIEHMQKALDALNERTAKRIARNVEGKYEV